ncbi:SYNAPSE-ASSOCIATED PROTEIN [Salix purpurea]|uniref:SYNAPSE-ASSOCIATED PROTEIN n=1 Tax=Salix purpurea TaxID=77065 RepID=A0A9Q0Z8G4_SALPP|nr:SYNAPSE-ASSOCIATED PROTEIN [Salix purpurea]
MNFFKSVFDDDPTPSNNPISDNPDPEPETGPSTLNLTWSFGSLVKTISTKSESILQTYKNDLQELRSGFNKETAVIRHVASRAVHDLPASFESGAAAAQHSLESVGQVIDDIGSTVWNSTAQIISHGKESVFSAVDHHRDLNDDRDASSSTKRHHLGVKYSRFDAQVRAVQCDLDTYCSEPGDKEDYEKWESESFIFEEKNEEIKRLISDNEFVNQIYYKVVPSKVDDQSFWSRYFYRLFKLKQAEEARVSLVKRAISGDEEEDLSWDFDGDDNEEEEEEGGSGFLSKGESNKESVIKEIEREDGDMPSLQSPFKSMDTLGEKGGSCKDSDVSIVSSQSLQEEDLGWDEIEDIGSNDESKVEAVENTTRAGASRVELHNRFGSAEEEDLSWDVEDEVDLPVK